MKVVTAAEMQIIDRITIERFGISGAILMERAGLAVVERITSAYNPGKVTIFCGTGNNGGDGLVAAREFHNRGLKVKVFLVGEKTKLSSECKTQYGIAKKMGVSIGAVSDLKSADFHSALVMDAIFGTGLSKPVKGKIAEVILKINSSGSDVVSVDIASGVSADTGRILGISVRADMTVTFGAPKRGHLLYPGASRTGKLAIADIGFPSRLFGSIRCSRPEKEEMSLLLPERPPYSHKGDYGHVLIVAGSTGKTGAALMAARACLRAGAGLVTLGLPSSAASHLQASVSEEMILPLPEDGKGALSASALNIILDFMDSKADVLAIGPGIGRTKDIALLTHEIIRRCTSPMVIDADAINALEGTAGVLANAKAPIILTPHPLEFSRISGIRKQEIEENRIDTACSFAKNKGIYLILKGAPTVIADPDGNSFINPTGNPGMAKAGTGDVLTGIAAALLAQGMSLLETSILGVYIHGLAGDISASEKGMRSIVASDIINSIPHAYNAIEKSCPA